MYRLRSILKTHCDTVYLKNSLFRLENDIIFRSIYMHTNINKVTIKIFSICYQQVCVTTGFYLDHPILDFRNRNYQIFKMQLWFILNHLLIIINSFSLSYYPLFKSIRRIGYNLYKTSLYLRCIHNYLSENSIRKTMKVVKWIFP